MRCIKMKLCFKLDMNNFNLYKNYKSLKSLELID